MVILKQIFSYARDNGHLHTANPAVGVGWKRPNWAEQKKNREIFGNAYVESDYVFTWADGHPYTPDYLSRKFKRIINKSEILDKRLHLHDLRVSCVSILINKGVNIKDVQKWVGHEDIQTTMNIYARTTRKRQYETGETMAKVMFWLRYYYGRNISSLKRR